MTRRIAENGRAILVLASLALLLLLAKPGHWIPLAHSAVSLWWDRVVPILFPGYLLGTMVTPLIMPYPEATGLLSLATFPLVGSTLALEQYRQGQASPADTERAWVFANFTNPWLLPLNLVSQICLVVANGSLCLAALYWVPIARAPRITRARLPVRGWPASAIDAMNWSAVYGAGVVMVTLLAGLHPVLTRLALLGEVVVQSTAFPMWVRTLLTASGGLVFLLPQLYQAHKLGLPALRLATWRLAAVGLAGFLAYILPHWFRV